MMATNAATLSNVSPTAHATVPDDEAAHPPAVPPSSDDKGGSSTSTRTMARSSTMSHPTAMRPSVVVTMPRASNARSSTTVLAMESARPNTMAPPHVQPQ